MYCKYENAFEYFFLIDLPDFTTGREGLLRQSMQRMLKTIQTGRADNNCCGSDFPPCLRECTKSDLGSVGLKKRCVTADRPTARRTTTLLQGQTLSVSRPHHTRVGDECSSPAAGSVAAVVGIDLIHLIM